MREEDWHPDKNHSTAESTRSGWREEGIEGGASPRKAVITRPGSQVVSGGDIGAEPWGGLGVNQVELGKGIQSRGTTGARA